MSKIFVDTSFIISLFRKNDSNHELTKKYAYLIDENECYITNAILTEIITVLMKKTKNIQLVETAYFYLNDNFIIVNEYDIEDYNEKVFSIFQKYNQNAFRVSFVDCSSIIILNYSNLDVVLSLDKGFKLFDEIDLFELH